MIAWWKGRSARERALISAAAALGGVIAYLQLILAPLTDARMRAERAYADAAAVRAEVRAGVAAVRAAPSRQGGSATAQSLRAAVSATAATDRLQITRVQPLEDGALNVSVEEADALALMRWLTRLDSEYGVRARRASISRNEGRRTVRATLVLARGSGA